jgi:hypothetical protein
MTRIFRIQKGEKLEVRTSIRCDTLFLDELASSLLEETGQRYHSTYRVELGRKKGYLESDENSITLKELNTSAQIAHSLFRRAVPVVHIGPSTFAVTVKGADATTLTEQVVAFYEQRYKEDCERHAGIRYHSSGKITIPRRLFAESASGQRINELAEKIAGAYPGKSER